MRDHRWSPDHMSEYMDADMEGGARDRLERHLRDCPECRELLRSLQSMVVALGALPGRPAASVSGAVLAGVHERLGAPADDDRPD